MLGEITLVVAGAPPAAGTAALPEAAGRSGSGCGGGLSRKDAIAAVAAELGLRRRELYAPSSRAARRPRPRSVCCQRAAAYALTISCGRKPQSDHQKR